MQADVTVPVILTTWDSASITTTALTKLSATLTVIGVIAVLVAHLILITRGVWAISPRLR
jgi:hypothetical protein